MTYADIQQQKVQENVFTRIFSKVIVLTIAFDMAMKKMKKKDIEKLAYDVSMIESTRDTLARFKKQHDKINGMLKELIDSLKIITEDRSLLAMSM